MREKLLKGSNKKRDELRNSDPDLVNFFSKVWKIRKSHMVSGLPPTYMFYLLCCYKPDCAHPICQSGPPENVSLWYPGGPPLTHLPLPVVDKERSWGSPCTVCKGFCPGHYKLTSIDLRNSTSLKEVSPPPSIQLKNLFHPSISEERIKRSCKGSLASCGGSENLARSSQYSNGKSTTGSC